MSTVVTTEFDLFRPAGVGVAQTELATGHFLHANPALCEMAGYSEAELKTMTNAELTHPEGWQRDAERFTALKQSELHESRAVTRFLHKEGHVVWLELAIY